MMGGRSLFVFGGSLMATLLVQLVSQTSADSSLSNGFGNNINWVTLNDGLQLAQSEQKPLMLVIHKSWCGACKALKPMFAESKAIQELSEKFIMVNTGDDDEPAADGDKYSPDGGYIPRVLFYNPDGTLIRDVINESGNPQYKYYYSHPEGIASSMQQVHDRLNSSKLSPRTDDEAQEESEEDQIINEDTRSEL